MVPLLPPGLESLDLGTSHLEAKPQHNMMLLSRVFVMYAVWIPLYLFMNFHHLKYQWSPWFVVEWG